MLLEKLIKNLPTKKKKIWIKGLAINSKKIKKGFIFFAIKGNKSNGENFIEEAIRRGASVVVCSKNCKYRKGKCLIIRCSDVKDLLSSISSKFFKIKPKNLIAVTGTNGKTSVADLFYQILVLNNKKVASIGTLGVKFNKKIISSNLTSPDIISLHEILEKIKKRGIDNVILEASSHGLHQKRIDKINFKAGIFTNFSQDHLDYHKTMNSYLKSKLILFNKVLPSKKTIISDKSLKEFKLLKKISKQRKLKLIDINKTFEKLKKNKKIKMNEFQIKNLSMAIEAAKICGLKERKIYNTLIKIKEVNGRLELVKTFSNNIKVFVDFAHTPDALLKTIHALKDYSGSNISLVFGCGGDRDFKKRPIMARIASKYCKNIYVTDDNPRNESPEKIRKEIIRNIKNKNCFNIGNRAEAIKTAILNADVDEIILVAGKGHETKQIYKDKIVQVSDKKIIRKLNLKVKKTLKKNLTYFENKKIFEKIKKNVKIDNFHGLAIDSRMVKKNNLFLTIKGKNHDGAQFIPDALKKGAKYILSSKNYKRFKKKTIKVNNEFKFLNLFASKKRENTKANIIAVTGSAGKTSLKNILKDLLQVFGPTYSSPKSYNNHFGVPLSLSQLNANHKFGVFEVGMSKPGEIRKLTKIIKPHLGIITNIGEAHIENFKNLRGIANAKGEIIDYIENNGTIILNRDDKFFHYLQKKAKLRKLRVVSFGTNKDSDICLVSKLSNKFKKNLLIKINNKVLKIENKNANVYNILSALATLNEMGLNLNFVRNYFKNYTPAEGRGKIFSVKRYSKKFKLIDESYNANPLSVKNAINNLNLIKKYNFKKYLLLGDMLELGKKSENLHKDISKVINNSDVDKVFVKGVKSLTTYRNIIKRKRGNIFQQNEDVDFILKNIIANNDYLMIKGSNATGLKDLSKRIIKGY